MRLSPAVLLWLLPQLVLATENNIKLAEVGLRTGIPATSYSDDITQVDLYMTVELPWKTHSDSRFRVRSRADFTVGAINGSDRLSVLGSFGLSVAISSAQDRIAFIAGTGPAGLSRYRFRTETFGGPLQFISHIGTQIKITHKLSATYRFQHMSNANIYDRNPGLNLHAISISLYR